jgi:hypothetical protein
VADGSRIEIRNTLSSDVVAFVAVPFLPDDEMDAVAVSGQLKKEAWLERRLHAAKKKMVSFLLILKHLTAPSLKNVFSYCCSFFIVSSFPSLHSPLSSFLHRKGERERETEREKKNGLDRLSLILVKT